MLPLVSVIIPVFNRPLLVKSAIDSVLSQTYDKTEVIIINDGSTDKTRSVLAEYEQRYPEKVFVLDQENSGQVIARNNGIESSRGELIAFLDSDDLWVPEKLEKQVCLFTGQVGLVYSGIHEIDSRGNIIRTVSCEPDMRGDIYRHLLVKNRMTGGTVVVSRDAINRVGLFDPDLRAAENWDLWIRISREFLVDFIDEPLVLYRKHTSNMSGDNSLMENAAMRILKKHFPVVPSDPVLYQSYNEAYINYYFTRSLYHFARNEYQDCRIMVKRIKSYGKLTFSMKLLWLRTFLGKGINHSVSSIRKNIKLYR